MRPSQRERVDLSSPKENVGILVHSNLEFAAPGRHLFCFSLFFATLYCRYIFENAPERSFFGHIFIYSSSLTCAPTIALIREISSMLEESLSKLDCKYWRGSTSWALAHKRVSLCTWTSTPRPRGLFAPRDDYCIWLEIVRLFIVYAYVDTYP